MLRRAPARPPTLAAWRRRFIVGVLTTLSLGIGAGHAAGIAVVQSQDLLPYREALEGIRDTIGGDLAVFDLKADPEAEEGVLRRLKAADPDLVIAIGARAAHVVRGKLHGVPTLFCMVLGSDLSGLAGPFVTGVALEVPVDRQIAGFRRVFPSLSRLGLLYDPEKSGALVRRARQAAETAGITLIAESVAQPSQVPAAFRRVATRADGIWIIPDSTVVSRESVDFILRQSVEHRIPVMVFSEPMVRAGGLVCFAAENREIGRQTGELALRVLRSGQGPLPPVEPPRGPRLVVNLKAAQAMGIEIPREILSEARDVFR